MKGFHWVDFRQPVPEPMEQLIWGITGQKPKPKLDLEAERLERQPAEKLRQPKHIQSADKDDLSSERGIDYTHLHDLLKAGKWKEADSETYRVMIRAVGKEEGDCFTSNELLDFPCKDLKTIDSLWVKYSNGRFGFSVQKQIYVECGAKLDGSNQLEEVRVKFCLRCGWIDDGQNFLIRTSDLQLNPNSSPPGELPFWRMFGWDGLATFLSHRGL